MSPLGTLLFALAVGANPDLVEGQRLYDAVQYKEAEARLRLAVDAPANGIDERRLAHDLLARCLLAQGRAPEAEEVYARLLASDPNAPTPQASPKVQDAFRRAKGRLYGKDLVRLVEQDAPLEQVRAQVVDPWSRVASLRLYLSDGQGQWVARPLEVAALEAGAPVPPLKPGEARRGYVEALDRAGVTIAALGSRAAPLVIPARPEATLIPPLPRPGDGATAELSHPLPARGSALNRFGPWVALGTGAAVMAAGGFAFIPASNDYAAAGNAPTALATQVGDHKAHGEYVLANGLLFSGLAVAVAGGAWLALR